MTATRINMTYWAVDEAEVVLGALSTYTVDVIVVEA